MKVKIYGASDDLIEVEGKISDEIYCLSSAEKGVNITISDGTKAKIKYNGEWKIEIIEKGHAFIELINSVGDDNEHVGEYEDCSSYSDILVLNFNCIDWIKIGRKNLYP